MGIREVMPALSDDQALNWAHAHWAFDDAALVSRAPWATTYRLLGGAHDAYLKLVPPASAPAVGLAARLAARFAGQVPAVLAHDEARGWLLSADHGGRTLDYDGPPEPLLALMRSYARMQAALRHEPAAWQGLPRVELERLPAQLLAFLQPPAGLPLPAGEVSAGFFIGAEAAARYHRLFQGRLALMAAHLQTAGVLPVTLNHGDLRPPNAAMTPAGDAVLMDWDDAVVGPAGMSLHGCFSGCTVPAILLSGSAAAQAAAHTVPGQRAQAYLQALVAAGYSDQASLQQALPAACFAGTVQFILNFARFGAPDRREAVAETMGSRLSDLLNICDLLAARDRDLALALAQDYVADGSLHRARGLLQDLVSRQQDDLLALSRLASVTLALEDYPFTVELAEHGLTLAPDDAALHACLALAQAAQLALGPATQALKRAVALAPAQAGYQQDLARVQDLARMRRQAGQPGRVPTLDLSPDEPASSAPRPEQVAMGAHLFRRFGTVQVNNAFPAEMIERLQQVFFERYTPYFQDENHPDALQLGDKRYMLTVDIDELFGHPDLIGMPKLMPIIREVLDDDFVLGAYTAVISLPGSEDQDRHKDHPALFPDTRWHHSLPCFAAQVSIPLVPMNEMTGATRVHKGTHRVSSDEAEKTPFQDPKIELGGVLLHDYRCMHLGVGNRSDRVRPVLTLVFTRPWFKDFKNYDKQPPLRISPSAYAQLPEALQPLFSWWMTNLRVDRLERSVLLAG